MGWGQFDRFMAQRSRHWQRKQAKETERLRRIAQAQTAYAQQQPVSEDVRAAYQHGWTDGYQRGYQQGQADLRQVMTDQPAGGQPPPGYPQGFA